MFKIEVWPNTLICLSHYFDFGLSFWTEVPSKTVIPALSRNLLVLGNLVEIPGQARDDRA